jgi:putative Holliday junction resolvase
MKQRIILGFVRVVGVDAGLRRVGLALSDLTGLLASPWKTIQARGTPREDAQLIASALADVEDGVQAIVVGHPRRLDGSATELTAHVEALAGQLRAIMAVPVVLQDERLTSHEAEGLLAELERDWKKRKAKLDAAAAAVLLQDYLDSIR